MLCPGMGQSLQNSYARENRITKVPNYRNPGHLPRRRNPGLDCSLLGAIAMHYAHLGLGLSLGLGLGSGLG